MKMNIEFKAWPKIPRSTGEKVTITEKLDWSNLWLFKLNWELIIAQRNNVFTLDELNKNTAYKWLIWWIEENKEQLDFCEWSWVFGEWIWMWSLHWPASLFLEGLSDFV